MKITNFKTLTRIQQVQYLVFVHKKTKVSFAKLCQIVWQKHRILITSEEIQRYKTLIPTHGINQRNPSQISMDLTHVGKFAITENVWERINGRNSRKGQW